MDAKRRRRREGEREKIGKRMEERIKKVWINKKELWDGGRNWERGKGAKKMERKKE